MSDYSIPKSGSPSIYDTARVNSRKREPKLTSYRAVADAAAGIDDSRMHSAKFSEQAAHAARMARSDAYGPHSNPRNLKGGRTRKTKRSHKRKTHRRRR